MWDHLVFLPSPKIPAECRNGAGVGIATDPQRLGLNVTTCLHSHVLSSLIPAQLQGNFQQFGVTR